jgi:hypothetical protein
VLDFFLTQEDRGKLVALVRDGSAASRVTRRANALVLLDGGWSCQDVAAGATATASIAPSANRISRITTDSALQPFVTRYFIRLCQG